MIDDDAPQPTPDQTRRARSFPLRKAVLMTVVSVAVFAAAIMVILNAQSTTTAAELAAVVALGSFGAVVYGLMRTLFVVVESAGERRRQERKATERRSGDRAANRADTTDSV